MTSISATVLADSLSPGRVRLTTLELVLPMFVQPQLLRHRAFSFSVQSTRAVPLKEQIRRVREAPCGPVRWGVAQKGMVATRELAEHVAFEADGEWQEAAAHAADVAERFLEMGIHQEVAARVLMPFQWCRCIVSATEWDNFFALRIDSHAQAEIRVLAEAIRDARDASTPRDVAFGEWHLPLVDEEDRWWLGTQHEHQPENAPLLISAGRCARVSFLQHDGTRKIERDLQLGERLAGEAHWSALEHQATPAPNWYERSGNFVGWTQFRKTFQHEDNRRAWLAAKAGGAS